IDVRFIDLSEGDELRLVRTPSVVVPGEVLPVGGSGGRITRPGSHPDASGEGEEGDQCRGNAAGMVPYHGGDHGELRVGVRRGDSEVTRPRGAARAGRSGGPRSLGSGGGKSCGGEHNW